MDLLKPPSDRFDMPGADIGLARRKGSEDLVHEGSEVASQQRFQGSKVQTTIIVVASLVRIRIDSRRTRFVRGG